MIVERRRRLLRKKAGAKGVHLVRDVDKPKETVTRHARKNENSGGLTATLAPLTLWWWGFATRTDRGDGADLLSNDEAV